MRLRRSNEDSGEGNVFWMTMTDLMTGLVLVFIIMFIYSYLTGQVQEYKQTAAKESATQALAETLKDQNIEATVDKTSGVVKISDLELFEINSYELSNKGKAYLDKFAPAYLNSLLTNEYMQENLQKIIIQGHTDSQIFGGELSEDEQYMKNMQLSLNRAYEVANYMTKTPYNKEFGNQLRKMVIVEGASSSDPIIVDGKEDYNKSRRVELKLVFKNAKLKTDEETTETQNSEQAPTTEETQPANDNSPVSEEIKPTEAETQEQPQQ